MEHSRPIVGRLAPSPTGAQHVGNARTYLLAWLAARSAGGRMILRIEDLDASRIRPGYTEQAIEDLRWLGLDWDEGPDVGGPNAPYVQSERFDRYAQVLDQLKAAELVYPCTCSRSDVLAAAGAPHATDEGPRYLGTCASRSAKDASKLEGRKYCWRFRASQRVMQVTDLIAGPKHLNVATELGDFVVAKTDGSPAYQLAVVVDDHAMGVTQVVRGDDLLPSMFRQEELYAALVWPPPQWAHVPLVVDSEGRRLAKRNDSLRLAQLRAAGVRPEQVVGLLAWSCGLVDSTQPLRAQELLADFDWKRLPREPWAIQDDQFGSIP